MRRRRGAWTEEKRAQVRKMHKQGYPIADIMLAVSLSYESVQREIRRYAQPGEIKTRNVDNPKAPRHHNGTTRAPITDDMATDRDNRAAAADRRTFTQTFFGDPPPGYSELDKRGASA